MGKVPAMARSNVRAEEHKRRSRSRSRSIIAGVGVGAGIGVGVDKLYDIHSYTRCCV